MSVRSPTLNGLAERVVDVAIELLAEPGRIRWTGGVVALVADGGPVGVRAGFTLDGGGEEAWALVPSETRPDAARTLAAYADRGERRWIGPPQGARCGLRVGAWSRSCAELQAIAAVYGEERARRSRVPLMHHIFAGIAVLRVLGASELAIRGFCLHPLVQSDKELQASWAAGRLAGLDPRAVALALEYRAVANSFLSSMEEHPGYADPGAIRLSPLAEVNAMLVADKIQNSRDFERFHRTTHPRAAWLERYFARWLAALGISDAQRDALVAEISVPSPHWGEDERL